jgi:acid phosphatase
VGETRGVRRTRLDRAAGGAVLLLGALLAPPGCGAPEGAAGTVGASERASCEAHDGFESTLWMQTALECRVLEEQAFVQAGERLEEALADPTWTAALEQDGELAGLPPAVILDVDMTVLDNTAFEARLVREGRGFERTLWDEWVARAEAPAVPGARAFVEKARSLGVEIFYVTNRRAKHEEATRLNLEAEGFPLSAERDTLLMRSEREEWDGNKSSRRRHVAATHRILLLVGDDMNDFLAGTRGPGMGPEERLARAEAFRELWGRRWIILPNPLYGSWQESLHGFREDLSAKEKRRLQLRALRPFESPPPPSGSIR